MYCNAQLLSFICIVMPNYCLLYVLYCPVIVFSMYCNAQLLSFICIVMPNYCLLYVLYCPVIVFSMYCNAHLLAFVYLFAWLKKMEEEEIGLSINTSMIV